MVMIIFYLYDDLVENSQGTLIPKQTAGGLSSYNASMGAFTIKEGKLIILKTRDEMTSNVINAMFIGITNM